MVFSGYVSHYASIVWDRTIAGNAVDGYLAMVDRPPKNTHFS
jgi:hypothetical protein